MASGGDGGAQGRERKGARGGDEHGESERASRGPRGVSRGRGSEQGGRRRWKQEVAAARLCARHARCQKAWGRRRARRWAGLANRAGQVGFGGRQVSFRRVSAILFICLCFLLFCNFRALLKIPKQSQNS